ncbi:MAG TPA: hypothetical protein VES67_03900 [Vicinamibacterales bacterium]|nr:hypothetical protein [Vicinamibacterales bacterium]
MLLVPAFAGAAALTAAAPPRFFPDDPIWVDDDKALDASKTGAIEDSNGYDFVANTFVEPGEKRDVRALNVNTVDEVPDSSWFTNRIGRRQMSIEEIVRGPDSLPGVSLDGWVVSGGKSTGVQPGFRMKDPSGWTYQIEFDPPSNPEMATAAEMIGTAFYYAMGYHTVDVYVAELDPAKVVIAPTARVFDPLIGERRAVTALDLDKVYQRAARMPNGRFRVLASRFASGKPLGNFRYYGTRPDDPNDIVPHEHRRELRGARVFGAWLNHDDSRGVNSLDFLVAEGGRNYVKHYMFDFGSILGSGTVHAQRHRAGNEYIFEAKPGWLTLATLGLYTRPWLHYSYRRVPPSVGRFEGDFFEAERWKPEYPNPAFRNMRADDAFWAARIVSRFTNDAIRAVVGKAKYSDPTATEYVTATLIKRRDKVLKTWLAGVNPLVDFALTDAGELTFANAAVDARVATDPGGYRAVWSNFDNVTRESKSIGETSGTGTRLRAPAGLPATQNAYLKVEIAATGGAEASWKTPVQVFFCRTGQTWKLVGVERMK